MESLQAHSLFDLGGCDVLGGSLGVESLIEWTGGRESTDVVSMSLNLSPVV